MTNDPRSPFIANQNQSDTDKAADWLENVPRPEISPTAKAVIRARMIKHAQQQDFQPQPLRPDFTPLLRWGVAACLVFVVLLTTGVPATLASVPGDVLYPIKLGIETVELNLAASGVARANTQLTHAERRIEEAAILAQRNQLTDQIIYAPLQHMIAAAAIARTEEVVSSAEQTMLQGRTVYLTDRLNLLLNDHGANDQLVENVLATESSGALLLPPTATSIPTETPTALPASSTPTELSDTATASPTTGPDTATETPTSTPTVTATAASSPTATLPITMFVEGRIEAIDDNIIVIYGIEHVIDATNPLLRIIRIGDYVRVHGDTIETLVTPTPRTNQATGAATVTAAPGSEGGQSGWQDNGSCDNPPPANAPAHGWRARCEGQPSPGNSGNGNNANNGNSGNNQGNSGNRGNSGNNNDDDD